MVRSWNQLQGLPEGTLAHGRSKYREREQDNTTIRLRPGRRKRERSASGVYSGRRGCDWLKQIEKRARKRERKDADGIAQTTLKAGEGERRRERPERGTAKINK